MEGQNHQVKRMTAAVGLPCLRLIRISIGPILLGNLKPGEFKKVPKPRI
jgi:23S rRNA pseudouridine2457 synthase